MSQHVGPSAYCSAKTSQLAFQDVSLAQVQGCFHTSSSNARQSLESIDVAVGDNILRADLFDVFAQAFGRDLTGLEIAAITKCFACDTSATVTWAEFARCFASLQLLSANPKAYSTMQSYDKARVAVRRHHGGSHSPQQQLNKPITSAQDIGWGVGLLPVVPRGDKCFPNKTTDVTQGEGSSSQAYFGMYLGKTLS